MGELYGVASCYLKIFVENIDVFAENVRYEENSGNRISTTLTERLWK